MRNCHRIRRVTCITQDSCLRYIKQYETSATYRKHWEREILTELRKFQRFVDLIDDSRIATIYRFRSMWTTTRLSPRNTQWSLFRVFYFSKMAWNSTGSIVWAPRICSACKSNIYLHWLRCLGAFSQPLSGALIAAAPEPRAFFVKTQRFRLRIRDSDKYFETVSSNRSS